jgi:hypothetical protein
VVLRKTYRAYLGLARALGPVHVYAQKTRIVFQRDVRFAGVIVRKGYLEGGMWLTRPIEHRTLLRRLVANARDIVHYFRLETPEDVDGELAALMAEAFAIGGREHLRKGRADTADAADRADSADKADKANRADPADQTEQAGKARWDKARADKTRPQTAADWPTPAERGGGRRRRPTRSGRRGESP